MAILGHRQARVMGEGLPTSHPAHSPCCTHSTCLHFKAHILAFFHPHILQPPEEQQLCFWGGRGMGAMEPGGAWRLTPCSISQVCPWAQGQGCKGWGWENRYRKQDNFIPTRTKPRTWSRALVAVPPAWAVMVPASSSWHPRTVSVRLDPFWAISRWGPGVTMAPLRSQVTSASGGETSHRNVASSPSWTVSGVSSEIIFTCGGSGGRWSGSEAGWVFPLPPFYPL